MLLSVIPAISIGVVSAIMSYNSNMDSAIQEMLTLSNDSSKRLRNRIDSYLNVAEVAGATLDLTFLTFPDDLESKDFWLPISLTSTV